MFIFNIIFSIFYFVLLRKVFLNIREWNRCRSLINNLPGAKGLPILGNYLEFRGDLKKVFKKMRIHAFRNNHHKIVRGWLLHFPFLFFFCPDEIEEVLTNPIYLTKAINYQPLFPWLGTGLVTSTGEKWRQRRKLLQPAFHFSILKKFVEVFRSESKHLVHQLKEHENDELNIVPIISKFILNSTCETFMGTTLKSDSLGKYYSSILKMGNICVRRATEPWMMFDMLYSLTPMRWRQRKLLNYLHKFSSDIIARRKKEFQDFMKLEGSNFESYSERKRLAMLDILLSAQKESGIIDDEGIREEVDSFMFAGYDTISLSLIHTLMLLANNRTEQEKIYEEIISVFGAEDTDVTTSQLQELKFMEMCIKESLRIYPSAPLIARNPSKDVETKSGNIIPKDTACFISIYDMHRKEDTFPNPEVFDPYRFLPENISKRHPFSYIPFSGGPRSCIGQRFAVLELKCALLEILKNFILEPVDTPETVEFVLDIVLRPAGPIRVKFKPRKG